MVAIYRLLPANAELLKVQPHAFHVRHHHTLRIVAQPQLVRGFGCDVLDRDSELGFRPFLLRLTGIFVLSEQIGEDTSAYLRAEMREHYRLRGDRVLSQQLCADSTGLMGKRLAALITLRDHARRVLQSQNEGWLDDHRQQARTLLNRAYDRFVAAYGPINKTTISTTEDGTTIRRMPNPDVLKLARPIAAAEPQPHHSGGYAVCDMSVVRSVQTSGEGVGF